jgi:hypothetical protein
VNEEPESDTLHAAADGISSGEAHPEGHTIIPAQPGPFGLPKLAARRTRLVTMGSTCLPG